MVIFNPLLCKAQITQKICMMNITLLYILCFHCIYIRPLLIENKATATHSVEYHDRPLPTKSSVDNKK